MSTSWYYHYSLRCSYCGSYLHTVAYCPKTYNGSANRQNLRCTYCGSNSHNKDACPEKWPGDNPVVIFDR